MTGPYLGPVVQRKSLYGLEVLKVAVPGLNARGGFSTLSSLSQKIMERVFVLYPYLEIVACG